MKKTIGKLAVGLVIVLVLAVVFLRGDQLQHLVDTIERGTPYFLIIAVLFQIGKYLCQALSFLWCFRAAHEKMPYREFVKLVFQTYFLDTAIPSMNISGTTIVIEEAKKHGIEPGSATGAALLRQVSISAAFTIIMILGFVFLGIIGKLEVGWLILGLCAILLVGALVGAMVLAAIKPDLVLKIARPFERIIDKVLVHFKKRTIDQTVSDFVDTYASSAQIIMKNKRDIARELGFSVLGNVMEIACFGFVGAAFGMHSIEIAICVYIVATLSGMISIVPQGVGIVEGASLVAFSLFGVDQATGMAIILVYRALIFWIPFLIGAVFMTRSGFHMSSKTL